MTAEVDVRRDACESEVSKCEEGNVNVGVIGNGISKDDGDGSYVFVTGSDAVASDESDLANGHCGRVETNGGGGLQLQVEESVVVVENPQSQLQSHSESVEKAEAAAEESTCSGDPEIAVESSCLEGEGDQQSVKEVLEEDLVQESELKTQADDKKVDEQIVSDPESKENGDGVAACDANDTTSATTAEQIGSSEIGRSVAADSVEVEVHLETQVVNDIVSDENGDGLSTHDDQERLSESLVTNHLVDVAEKNNESCEENVQILDANSDIQESVSEALAEEVNDGPSEQNGHILTANVDVKERILEPIGTCEESGEILAVKSDIQESALDSLGENVNGVSEDNGQILGVSEDNGQILVVNGDIQESALDSLAEKINGESEDNGQILAVNLDLQESVSEPIAKKINGSYEVDDQNLAVKVDVQESVSQPIAEKINGLCEENCDILAVKVDSQESVSVPIAEKINGSCEENGHMLAVKVDSQNSVSEPIAENINGSCEENGQMLAAKVDVEESVSEPIAEKVDGLCEKNGQILAANGDSQESILQHIAEKMNGFPCEENGQILAHNLEVKKQLETEVDNVLVSDKSGDESLIVHAHEESISVPIDTTHLADTPEEHGSCENGVVGDASVEVQKQLEAPVDNGPIVHSQQENISEENGSSEKASVCENVPVENGESCATVADSDTIVNVENEDSLPKEDDSTCSIDDGMPEQLDKKSSEKLSFCPCEPSKPEVEGDAGVSNLEAECADDHGKPALQIDDLVENEATLPASSGVDEPSIISDAKPESEVGPVDSLEGHDKVVDVDESSIITDVKSESEVAPVDSLEGQDKVVDVVKRPFYYLIRIPRNDDENLKEQIKHAQLQVEEKTRDRDAIRSKMQMQRATCKDHKLQFEAAISEERAAQELLKAKRREMDSVLVMSNKLKDALSVEQITNTIRQMEHTLTHETVPLKEEKQYIRDIKQLKQRRDQLSYSLAKQDEVQQSLDQKDHIGKRIQDLKLEMDQLKNNLVKAQGVTQAAKKKYNGENDMLHELQYQFEAADATRQEAYVHLQSLRKQNYEKTKHYWRYRNDAKAANDLALSGDKEQVQHLCINQVESFMELWRTNGDFRKEYIKCNTRSTLRRLRTLDGRSLGPDEEPPVIPDIVRVTRHHMPAAVVSTPEPAKRVAIVESEEPNDKSGVEIVEPNNETAKNKKPVKVASSGISQATVSGKNEIVEEIVDDPKPTKEEVELARKEEELRKEEAAAKLREQRRLEEKAKTKEAMERKKRITEKAQARAAIKAQKEAEEKEKEREKRARKKERKKASATKATNGINEGEFAPEPSSETTTETPVEPEAAEKPVKITKRSQKMSQFTKQSKVKPIPLPLRNRSKRRMQPWMWVFVAIVAMLGLFLMGNGGSFSFKSMLERFS
ncbi:PREDICTED: uncharacterized protein LOC101298327 [Fragaria vesca subsp. vesca]|uniref:uncharacterized protein LOC101298327 n=1 Tax=Fragaria vesca subsp. vesca TaxID=101020 RepID=UPI0002C325A4|nr:PREDICTED: uncharacterized protein LOC101298327 [Fragaria vesca subsp. vesca]